MKCIIFLFVPIASFWFFEHQWQKLAPSSLHTPPIPSCPRQTVTIRSPWAFSSPCWTVPAVSSSPCTSETPFPYSSLWLFAWLTPLWSRLDSCELQLLCPDPTCLKTSLRATQEEREDRKGTECSSSLYVFLPCSFTVGKLQARHMFFQDIKKVCGMPEKGRDLRWVAQLVEV